MNDNSSNISYKHKHGYFVQRMHSRQVPINLPADKDETQLSPDKLPAVNLAVYGGKCDALCLSLAFNLKLDYFYNIPCGNENLNLKDK